MQNYEEVLLMLCVFMVLFLSLLDFILKIVRQTNVDVYFSGL